jgi:hypothetical protein
MRRRRRTLSVIDPACALLEDYIQFKVRRLGVLSRTGTARVKERPGKQLTLQARAPGTDGGRLDEIARFPSHKRRDLSKRKASARTHHCSGILFVVSKSV